MSVKLTDKLMLTAIDARRDWQSANTKVKHDPESGACFVYLYDAMIAQLTDSWVTVSDCGYQTPTTKSRLKAILESYTGATVFQENKQWLIHKGRCAPERMLPGSNWQVARVK